MAFVVTVKDGDKFLGFVSTADWEGLRYNVQAELAEYFKTREAAERGIMEIRQIREAQKFQYEIVAAP